MERLSKERPTGITGSGLRTWGLVFLAMGIFSRGILQTRVLGVGQLTAQQLLAVMENNMMAATLALVLQAVESCAAPIYALLVVDGFQRTGNYRDYLLRVLGLAVLTELPYNLAMSGRLLDMGSRNPVFGVALCLIVLYFYRRYEEKGLKNTAIKAVVTLAGVIWANMLRIQDGGCLLVLAAVIWIFRKKPMFRNFAGMSAAVLCTLFSPFYLAAPMGFLAIHFYNGEKGESGRLVNYLAYPALLLVVGLAAMFI